MSFLGMRGTGDWAANQRPESFRETILYLYPNGMAPLTGMLSKMKNLEINDPVRHWFTKTLQTRSGAITGVFTDAGLSTAYAATGGAVAGDTLYIKMAAATVAHFVVGAQVLLRDASDLNVDVNAKVMARVSSGANSYLQVKLLENDDNGAVVTTNNLNLADTILRIGNLNSEGSAVPNSLRYDPVEYTNNCQIFRTPADMTKTAMATKLRTGDPWKEDIREALEYHGVDMEMAIFWGKKSSGTGANGKPERSLDGIIPFTKTNNPTGVFNYVTDPDFSGQTWIQGGKKWLNRKLETFFRFGRPEGLAWCGSGALLGIQELAEAYGQINLESGQKDYGIEVTTWRTVFGPLHLKTHPLFSYETSNQNLIVAMRPENLTYCYLPGRDTFIERDVQIPGVDGKTDCYTTECTLEIHHPETFAIFQGVGQDNTV
jgi:hypothetical protein